MYRLIIRSVLEFALPLWTGALTLINREKIERVQKACFKLMLSNKYTNYETALKLLDEQTLQERRQKLCLKFAKKSAKNPKMKHLFKKQTSYPTRLRPYMEPLTHSKRAYTGCIPHLIRLLNEDALAKSKSGNKQ